MSAHYAGAIVYAKLVDILAYVALNSRSTLPQYESQGEQVKFPGGSNRDYPDETDPWETCKRELFQETGLRVKPGVRPVIMYEVTLGNGHRKVFYIISIEDCEGELRTEEIMDGDDRLSAPYLITEEAAREFVYETHQPALQRAIDYNTYLVG